MLKLGLCCGVGLCCLLAGALLWVGVGAVAGESIAASAGCSKTSTGCSKASAAKLAGLTADEQKVVTSVVDLGCLKSNCSRFSACSVDRNLALAKDDELKRYEQEVALDGKPIDNWHAPDFTLPDTAGRTVSLSDYRGKNVVVVFLSGHCYHSVDTLPILADLREKYASHDLEILPVFVNSGDVQDLKSRAWEWDVEYSLIVSEDKAISRAYDSRMVPSTFLIDEEGRVTRKLVGFKTESILDEAISELVGS